MHVPTCPDSTQVLAPSAQSTGPGSVTLHPAQPTWQTMVLALRGSLTSPPLPLPPEVVVAVDREPAPPPAAAGTASDKQGRVERAALGRGAGEEGTQGGGAWAGGSGLQESVSQGRQGGGKT